MIIFMIIYIYICIYVCVFVCVYVCVVCVSRSDILSIVVVNDTILKDLPYFRLYNISSIYFIKCFN